MEDTVSSDKHTGYDAWLWRLLFYLSGMIILALGITLNTKTGLGVSAIVSIPYCLSGIMDINFGNATFLIYTLFVFIQVIIKKKNTTLFDIMQILVSLVFSRLMNLFSDFVNIQPENMIIKLLILCAAIICTGVGAAMTVNARLIANPADAIIQTIADVTGKEMGLVKNLFDAGCLLISVMVGLIFRGRLVGVGIGTFVSMLGVGRVIWLYNRILKKKTERIMRRGYENEYKESRTE